MSDDYRIGSTEEGMVLVTSLASKSSPPGGSTVAPHMVYRTAASGMKYGDGTASCKWEFASMTPEFYAALVAYLGGMDSNWVYLRTRKDDNTFSTYTAIMHRPILDETKNWRYGRWHDVVFEFTDMNVATPTLPPGFDPPPTEIEDGSIIRYNDGDWEVVAEPFVFKGLVLTPALASLIDVEGAIYYDSSLKAILVCTGE